jgi:multiple sugar transport system ATP-binding protein
MLYSKPNNLFVAGFMGSPQMNFIDSTIVERNGELCVEFGDETKCYIALPASKVEAARPYLRKEVVMGIRPENISDTEAVLAAATTGVVDAVVELSEMMGAETYLYLACAGSNIIARVSPRSHTKEGEKIRVAFDPNKVHLFDKDTEKTITN